MSLFKKDLPLRTRTLLLLWGCFCICFPLILYKYTDLKLFVMGKLPSDSEPPTSFFILYFGSVFIHTIFTLLLNWRRVVYTFIIALFLPLFLLLAMAIGSSAHYQYTIEDNMVMTITIYCVSTIAVLMSAKLKKYFS